jgi:hypothetical protein
VNGLDAFAVGIAPQHVPALLAACLLPVLVFIARRLRGQFGILDRAGAGIATRPGVDRPIRIWVAWLLGTTAAVHLALPLGHYDGPLLAIGFLASGVGYAWLAMRALEGRSWRLMSAPLLIATLIAYLSVVGTGREEPDQVGIATALVELAALGFCLVPSREPVRPRRFKRFAGSAGTVFSAFVVGAVVWVGSFAAHTGDHQHAHVARAQAGVIMRPASDQHPTFAQEQAADLLATATRTGTQRYATLDAAIAAGYELPKVRTGMAVHLENKAFTRDGRVLDPQRPETLVFAIDGGRATLLGALFQLERAGVAGPEPGGPVTRWHAHNICLTALPPGFGIVSPFGTCPAFSVNLTTPEMMHVWVVANPRGWFADDLDATWVRGYHAAHGQPYATR